MILSSFILTSVTTSVDEMPGLVVQFGQSDT